MRTVHGRSGFTIVELMIAMVAAIIMLLGMGAVMLQMYRGFDESRDFSEATSRIDLIRSMQFDARTSRALIYPTSWDATGTALTSRGDIPVADGYAGDRVQFISLQYDTATATTTPFRITWQSRRPLGSPAGTPYTVERWTIQVDAANVPLAGPQSLRFVQPGVGLFEVVRTNNNSFRVDMRAVENEESAAIQLQVTCRNVIN